MRRITIIIGCCMLLVTLQFIFSCVDSKDRKKISIAYANWAEGIAMTNLAKVILEDQGYRVTLKNADIAPIFTSVASGKADVFMDAWLPVTHADYMEQYGDRLETLGTVYEHAKLGLVVPEYVTIRSIEDLNAHKDQFKGEIIGIDAGAGLMNSADKAVQDYSLDFDLKSSSGATMVAFLKKSIDANEWIVVTGWTPHWMFSRYPLKFLEDPKEEFGDSEHIEVIATKGFSEKDPYAASFFKNFKLTDEQLSELMYYMEDGTRTESRSARAWLEKHPEIIKLFLPSQENQLNGSHETN